MRRAFLPPRIICLWKPKSHPAHFPLLLNPTVCDRLLSQTGSPVLRFPSTIFKNTLFLALSICLSVEIWRLVSSVRSSWEYTIFEKIFIDKERMFHFYVITYMSKYYYPNNIRNLFSSFIRYAQALDCIINHKLKRWIYFHPKPREVNFYSTFFV